VTHVHPSSGAFEDADERTRGHSFPPSRAERVSSGTETNVNGNAGREAKNVFGARAPDRDVVVA
jgi:hypothetical protein